MKKKDTKFSPYHEWGDEWFEQYGKELDTAIAEFSHRVKHEAKIFAYIKEKYGTMRVDVLSYWTGGLHPLVYGHRVFIGDSWFARLLWRIDTCFFPIERTTFGWYKVGLTHLLYKLGITQVVNKWQRKKLQKIWLETANKYQNVKSEILYEYNFYFNNDDKRTT